MLIREKTRQLQIGNLKLGGQNQVIIQSMTNTLTSDIKETTKQIIELEEAGVQMIRLAIFNSTDALAIKELKTKSKVPLIADIHFDYRLALLALENGIDKIRLNPGNISDKKQLKEVIDLCKKRKVPIRIGVNAGSLPNDILQKHKKISAEAMLEAAKKHITLLQEEDFHDICLSFKASNPNLCIEAYQLASSIYDYPLHLGVSEAGPLLQSCVRSSAALGILLNQGIGDTIRISISGDPTLEVKAAKELLACFKLTADFPSIISCPTCGRLQYSMLDIIAPLEDHIKTLKVPLKIAVMGCAVNGPGEAREADIGIAGGKDEVLLFKRGEIIRKIAKENILKEFLEEITLMSKSINKN